MSLSRTDRKGTSVILVFTIMGVFTALIHFFGSFFPGPATWGFHQLAFLPPFFRIAIPLLMILFTIRLCQSYILTWLDHSTDKLAGKSKTFKRLILFIFTAAVILLLWSLRQKFFMLGDGSLIVRIINSQQSGNVDAMVFANEPLAGYILISLSKLFSFIIPPSSDESPIQMAVISIAAVCLFLSWQLVRTLSENRTERLLFYGSIVLSGTLQILFGYIETYIPLYCGILFFVTLSLKYLKGASSLILPASVFGILFCLHFGALVFFPALCFLLLHDYRESKGKNIPAAIFSMLVVIAAILWFLGYPLQRFTSLFANSGKHLLITKSSSPAGSYGLFSVYHTVNLLNFLFLMGIFYIGSFFLLIGNIFREKSDRTQSPFLFLFGMMGLLFVLFFRTEIGMSRDWDILAVFYSVLVIAAATYAAKCLTDSSVCRRLMIMMVGITALQCFSFVLLNSDESRARERFEILPDNRLWQRSGLISAYEELSIYYRGRMEPRPALKYLSKLLDIDSTNPRIYRSTAHIYSLMKDTKNEIEYLHRALELSPSDWEIYLELSASYVAIGRHDRAVSLLQKALALHPKSPDINCSLGMAMLNLTNDCPRAIVYFNITLELDPSYANAYAGLAYCAAGQNDFISAREYKRKYLQSKPMNSLSAQIFKMLEEIQ